MIPNKSLNQNFNTSGDLVSSRAYTFLDSYIYMKNSKYNALYQHNKEMLAIEKEALEKNSVDILYYALTEQTKMLNTVIIRIRNFAQNIRADVIQNLQAIIPDADKMRDYEEALNASNIPPQKVVNYKISPIEYPNMAVFYALFKRELKEFAAIKDEGAPIDNPFIHNVATKFLIKSTEETNNDNNDILTSEDFFMTTKPKLYKIKEYFTHKGEIITGINKDFRTFYFYLRQFRMLQKVMLTMEPTQMTDGRVAINGTSKPLASFADYLILYKHYTVMIKYMLDVISNFDQKFFNKIYAIQSNIEVYRATMNSVISYYRTQMRNNESADIDAMVGGVGNAMDFLNDGCDPFSIVSDKVKGAEIPQSEVEDPEEVFDYDIEDEEVYEGPLDDDEEPTYQVPPIRTTHFQDAVSAMNCVDKANCQLQQTYDTCQMKDLIKNKPNILTEAAEAQVNAKKAIALMRDAIIASNAKFKDYPKALRDDNAEMFEALETFDIGSADLSGIEFDCFKYAKGYNIMNHIRIPSYRADDNDLLIEGEGIGYKQKYFKDIYYFSYKHQPLNKNKLRGSQAKTVITGDKVRELFDFFMRVIDEYPNIVRSMSHANTRIANALKVDENLLESAYGSNNALIESIMINRSIFRDDIYSILLEANIDDMIDSIGPETEEEKPKEQAPASNDEQKSQEPTEPETTETNTSEDLNIDDAAAEKANNAKVVAEALRMYCKICYEVNSSRMDIYEEILDTAYQFIKMVIKSVPKDPKPDKVAEAPVEEEEINTDDHAAAEEVAE